MIKGERIQLRIEALDGEASGVATYDGRRIHIPFALPGERVVAQVVHESPHRPEAWAELVEVSERSGDRVPPACSAWGRCGGCVLQHLRYDAQPAFKERLVREPLEARSLEAPVTPCVPSPRALGYRNRSKLVAHRPADDPSRLLLGAYAPRSHDFVELAGCAVAEPPLDEVARVVSDLATRLGVRPYDERTREGDLRHVVLRVNFRGEVLALFVVARRGGHNIAELSRMVREARPDVVGVVENLQPDAGNVIVGHVEPDLVLDGAQAIEERIGAIRLRLSAASFLQANRDVAAKLYADLASALAPRPSDRIVDVYCGVGAIALTLGQSGAVVHGIEEVDTAVADARAGSHFNQLPQVQFSVGDAIEVLARHAGDRADLVVLNPPRKGCDEKVLSQVATLSPRAIAYVSCAPDTLARDLSVLASRGYGDIERVTPYDMLPHTPHVEALAILRRS